MSEGTKLDGLGDAKEGRIVAGGVCVVLGPSNFAAFSAMSVHPAEVIAGAEVMKADVITKMRQPPRHHAILRAGPGIPALRN